MKFVNKNITPNQYLKNILKKDQQQAFVVPDNLSIQSFDH